MSFENKKTLFLGDSITALGTGERGWVGYFNQAVKPSFFVNLAVSGARLSNGQPVEFDGNPVFAGDNTDYNQNVLLNQVEKLSRGKDTANKHYSHNPDYDDFDLIIIAAGTNDWFCKEKCDIEAVEAQFTKDGKVLPLSAADPFTWPGAMRIIYDKLRRFYPNAVICFCSPVQSAEEKRTYTSILYKRNLMKSICERISDVTFIDAFCCGICGAYEFDEKNGRDLIDGLHPNASGAKKLGRFIARAVELI